MEGLGANVSLKSSRCIVSHVEKRRHRLPGIVIFLLVMFVPAGLIAYVFHNLAWLVAVPIAIFVLILAVAFVFGTLEKLFGIGRRKGTPEEFANALEKDLLGEEPERGWDEPMEVTLADPRLEQVRRSLCPRPNLYRLATQKDKDELRSIIVALRRGDLPDVPPQSGIMSLFRFRK
jgi:hypothetical protein